MEYFSKFYYHKKIVAPYIKWRSHFRRSHCCRYGIINGIKFNENP